MSNNAQQIGEDVAAKFLRKVARLYLSSELPEDEPVEPVEVLDALITEARQATDERPDDI